MFRRETPWLLAAFVVGLFLVGLPQWSLPAHGRLVPDPLMVTGLAGLSVLAMMLLVGQIAGPVRTGLVMSLCLPTAVLVRLLAGMGGRDPWPLELALAVGAGAGAVLPGILAGMLACRLQSRGRG